MSDLRCEYCRRNQPVKAVENDFCEHTGLTYEELVSQLSTYKEALEKAEKTIKTMNSLCMDYEFKFSKKMNGKANHSYLIGCFSMIRIIGEDGMKKALTPVQSTDAREKETR